MNAQVMNAVLPLILSEMAGDGPGGIDVKLIELPIGGDDMYTYRESDGVRGLLPETYVEIMDSDGADRADPDADGFTQAEKTVVRLMFHKSGRDDLAADVLKLALSDRGAATVETRKRAVLAFGEHLPAEIAAGDPRDFVAAVFEKIRKVEARNRDAALAARDRVRPGGGHACECTSCQMRRAFSKIVHGRRS
jgi:hypothetical protein